MKKKPIYSIGHGTRKIEEFISILQEQGINCLADVRSRPYSRYNPQYNRDSLKHSLENSGITYVFMGDTLGGRPEDPSCYHPNGKVDYEKVKTHDFFRKGIERLKTAYQKNIPLAIMCSESKPAECHRTKLIGEVLAEEQIPLRHIDEKNKLKTQAEVSREMTRDQPGNWLFS